MKVYSLIAEQGSPRYLQYIRCNYWFWERGYEVISFSNEELFSGAFDKILQTDLDDIIFVGSVGVMYEVIRRANKPKPDVSDFPDELKDFFGRKIFVATMADVHKWIHEEPHRLPLHIKPADKQKLFVGAVVEKFRDIIPMSHVSKEEPVFAQEVIKMKSEWRASILRKKIINVSHYHGDPLLFPDKNIMVSALEKFSKAPIGFAMDWAVLEDGRTVLIEVNDGFGLGNYGVPGHLYTALIECRWRELMGLKDNGVGLSK